MFRRLVNRDERPLDHVVNLGKPSRVLPRHLRAVGEIVNQVIVFGQKMTARLRSETVMTLDWIAERLCMGCRHTLANCLKRQSFSTMAGLTPFRLGVYLKGRWKLCYP